MIYSDRNRITSCLLRFFLNKNITCETPYMCDSVPSIPKIGEIVNLVDGWEPCKVTNVVYNYPQGKDEELMIDISAESCEYEYGCDEEDMEVEEVWE